MQKQLQDAMRATSATSDYRCFQHVAVRDHHMIWHRAVIVRAEPLARVYFIDTGREEDVVFSPDHLRPLPSQFVRPAAFAIPCRLYQIRSLDSLQPFSWKDNDPVHDEWKKMMNKNVQCRVCRIEEDVCYEVDLDLPGE